MTSTISRQNPHISFRVAGILIKKGKILIQRGINDEEYALPGGHVEMFERSEDTLIREFKEEINAEINISRLLWIQEHMAEWNQQKYHEICFYFLIDIPDETVIPSNRIFYSCAGNDSEIEFSWVETEKIMDLKFYPVYIKSRLNNLPDGIEKFVEQEIFYNKSSKKVKD